MRGIFLFILVGCLTACSGGGSSGGSSPSTPTNGWVTYYVATRNILPSCAGDIIGRLYYVEDQANFQVCKTTGWVVINVGNAVTSSTRCYKVNGGYSYEYLITDFTNGDKFVSCNVWGSAMASSNSIYWKSTLIGATNESCYSYYDIDAASAGFWTFSKTTGVRKVMYTDAGSASNGAVVTYASGDCVVGQ